MSKLKNIFTFMAILLSVGSFAEVTVLNKVLAKKDSTDSVKAMSKQVTPFLSKYYTALDDKDLKELKILSSPYMYQLYSENENYLEDEDPVRGEVHLIGLKIRERDGMFIGTILFKDSSVTVDVVIDVTDPQHLKLFDVLKEI